MILQQKKIMAMPNKPIDAQINGQSEKIEQIKNYLDFIQSTGECFDGYLDLLIKVRYLNQAVCEVFQASEVLDVMSAINSDLFKIAAKSIGEFEAFAEYGYRQGQPYETSPDDFTKLKAKARKK